MSPCTLFSISLLLIFLFAQPVGAANVKVYGPAVDAPVKAQTTTYLIVDCKEAGPGQYVSLTTYSTATGFSCSLLLFIRDESISGIPMGPGRLVRIPREWKRARECLVGNGTEWNQYISHFPHRVRNKPMYRYVYCWKKDRCWGKVTQFRHFLYFNCDFQLFLMPFRREFAGYWFHDVHENSNRCDEILVWEWQREEMGITYGFGNGMGMKGIKPGWAWEQEWE